MEVGTQRKSDDRPVVLDLTQPHEGVKKVPSLKESLTLISKALPDIVDAFYSTARALTILSPGSPRNVKGENDAVNQIKNAEACFVEKVEELQTIFQKCYTHACDYVLIRQSPPSSERDGILSDCLVSARFIHQNLSKWLEDFEQQLVHLESQKPSILTSGIHAPSSPNTISLNNAFDTLLASLNSLRTQLQAIITFWSNHARALYNESEPAGPQNAVGHSIDSSDNQKAVDIWLGYQMALISVSASLTKSVDSMGGGPKSRGESSMAQKKKGVLRSLQDFWRLITLTRWRVQGT
ncbi:hypothetical protein CVT24_013021 [Panaeolus cyanescens]|uniref:Uncharacterized protein n=1 Tax=Panaeolus cyanescens TaxID=181874 RepID=A0A409WDL0_9AGAR|nr:hypothetical protein CVT24_013021 [Panaeolus cyanescens]